MFNLSQEIVVRFSVLNKGWVWMSIANEIQRPSVWTHVEWQTYHELRQKPEASLPTMWLSRCACTKCTAPWANNLGCLCGWRACGRDSVSIDLRAIDDPLWQYSGCMSDRSNDETPTMKCDPSMRTLTNMEQDENDERSTSRWVSGFHLDSRLDSGLCEVAFLVNEWLHFARLWPRLAKFLSQDCTTVAFANVLSFFLQRPEGLWSYEGNISICA